MIVNIKVKTRARENKIVKDANLWIVYIKECAEKGKANKELINVLSEYLDISKSKIKIVSGKKSHNKLIEIG